MLRVAVNGLFTVGSEHVGERMPCFMSIIAEGYISGYKHDQTGETGLDDRLDNSNLCNLASRFLRIARLTLMLGASRSNVVQAVCIFEV